MPLSRRAWLTGTLGTAVLLTGCATPTTSGVAPAPEPPAPTVLVRDDLRAVFDAAGVVGTFALLDVETNQLTLVNPARAQRRAVPASTFKVAHSLIALETGVVRDVDEIIPYGGEPQPIPAWEQDMSIRQAVPASNAAIFQQIARRVGAQREREWLERLDYGNREVGSAVDRFWLDGPLMISPVEQTAFLARLAQRRLPASVAAQEAVTEVLELQRTADRVLYGKTGWRFEVTPQLGWWVGWVRGPDGLSTFALNMDMAGKADADKRVPLGRELLRRLGILP